MNAGESTLRIGLVYPDILGTYGDRGNALIIAQRAQKRGIAAEIIEIDAREPISSGLDFYLLGGGEDDSQHIAARSLQESRSALIEAHNAGAAIVAVCAGFQLLGHSYEAADGSLLEGIGLIDMITRAGANRSIGEVVIEAEPSPNWGTAGPPSLITGFENHGGRTQLGQGVVPLGQVKVGTGNGNGSDGVLGERLLGTYLHGPVLARNPELADRVLSWVVGPLEEIDDSLERRLHDECLSRGSAQGVKRWWQNRMLARG